MPEWAGEKVEPVETNSSLVLLLYMDMDTLWQNKRLLQVAFKKSIDRTTMNLVTKLYHELKAPLLPKIIHLYNPI